MKTVIITFFAQSEEGSEEGPFVYLNDEVKSKIFSEAKTAIFNCYDPNHITGTLFVFNNKESKEDFKKDFTDTFDVWMQNTVECLIIVISQDLWNQVLFETFNRLVVPSVHTDTLFTYVGEASKIISNQKLEVIFSLYTPDKDLKDHVYEITSEGHLIPLSEEYIEDEGQDTFANELPVDPVIEEKPSCIDIYPIDSLSLEQKFGNPKMLN